MLKINHVIVRIAPCVLRRILIGTCIGVVIETQTTPPVLPTRLLAEVERRYLHKKPARRKPTLAGPLRYGWLMMSPT